MAEILVIDSSRTYNTGLIGTKSDDHYPVGGRKIARIEFNRKIEANGPFGIGGHGDAYVQSQDSNEVVVHYWADFATNVSYTLRVWVVAESSRAA